LRRLKSIWAAATFYNLYGPTETNVVTWYKVPKEISEKQNSPFPIGHACPYADCKIWKNEILDPIPGTSGELIVSGASVAAGYWNLPQKNKANFFEEAGMRWYRTGDIVSVNDQSELVYQGREDRMVKRNGYRIELAEIERVLALHPDIIEVAVVVPKNEKDKVLIKAFVRFSESEKQLDIMDLRTFCLRHLPGYMMPDQYVLLEEFPKTSTQKVDYQNLMQQAL